MGKKAVGLGVVLLLASAAWALDMGDKAPPLHIAKWIKGDPVDPSKPDGKTTYVVEFWATWCPPCRQSIPHLSGIQERFKDKSVVVIGISTEDAATVAPFVAKQPKMDYHVAVDDAQKTSNVWMEGVGGIPHAFIVDKNGVVCWTGHPMAGLDEALEGIVAGTFDMATAKKITAKKDELQKALQSRDIEKILTVVDELIKLEPTVYQHYDLKLKILNYKKDTTGIVKTRKEAAQAFLKAKAQGALNNLAWAVATDDDLSRRDLDLALTCAQKAVDLTERKSSADLDTLARVYYAIGLLDKAISTQQEAIAAAAEGQKGDLQNNLKFYESVKALRAKLMRSGK
ncbi:MAG: TlpA family protein disulfide reductase [Planctomycetes bacterium]|nr:TlpA family protein disulfide reductase [Planctomycetota bacterium]